MRSAVILAFCPVILAATASTAVPDPVSLSPADAAAWVRHVTPLPKKIEITASRTVPAQQVRVIVDDRAEPLVQQAARELREALGQRPDARSAANPAFIIQLEMGGPDAQTLTTLPNNDQAYRILPDADRAALRVVALAPHGLYYGSKTLQHLIRPKASRHRITLPILRVTDWPDMRDRGLWGSDAFLHIRWLSDRKINYMEQIASSRVDKNGETSVGLSGAKQRMVDEGPTYGIRPVPAVVHVEHWAGHGLTDAYPQTRARGGEAGALCYAHSDVISDVLADWIVGYAHMPGVTDVDVWMTENLHGKGGCRCPECRKHNRDMQEARMIVAGWEKARKRTPDIRLRVLTSEETADSNKQILEFLPPDVSLWYYHSLLTYTSGHDPMVKPYLADSARKGRSIGICCSVSAFVGLTLPFTGIHFMHGRMNEFVDKGMSGVLGYATPRVHYAAINTEAMAEWSWNAHGRTPREFAYSYAVRNDIADPDTFAEWAESLSPVAWDVYGSDWPFSEKQKSVGKAAKRLREGKLPELGHVRWGAYRSPWGDIKTVEQLDADVAKAKAAVTLARKLNIPLFTEETLVVEGLTQSLKALWELRSLVTPNGIDDANKTSAARYFQMYVDGLTQAKAALPRWERHVNPDPKDRRQVRRVIELLDEAVTGMTALAADNGVNLKARKRRADSRSPHATR
jgi:hypothetical protein